MQSQPDPTIVSKIRDQSLISNANSILITDDHAEAAGSIDSKQNKRSISYF